MNKKTDKSTKKLYKHVTIGITITVCLFVIYSMFFSSNIEIPNNEKEYLFAVPSGSDSKSIITSLENEVTVHGSIGFSILAKVVNLDGNIYPGLYKLSSGMSNIELIMLLRSGKRQAVSITIKFGRYAQDIIHAIAPKIEASHEELLSLLENEAFLDSLGFTKETAICLFIPDTYEFKWNTSARGFFMRMKKEYDAYWEKHLKKAEALNLSPFQVMTIASIINQESNKNDEKPRIAGVYYNRYLKNMPLQADPTVKYALGDFSIKRVRKGHLLTKSPYNTYRNSGLPPGPICTPDKVDIEAVLSLEKHSFIFFCAKPDYSGYHRFAVDYGTHVNYAKEYSNWLDSENIQ